MVIAKTIVEYGIIGKTGGKNRVALQPDEMPKHRHTITGQYMQKEGSRTKTVVALDSSMDVSHGNVTYDGKIGYAGEGYPHENRPPFIVMAYIIKVKD